MGNTSITYSTKDYKLFKAFISSIIIVVATLGVLFYISLKVNIELILIVGMILLFTVPFFFQKKFKIAFSLRTELEFNDNNLLIRQFKTNDHLIRNIVAEWSNIKSFRIQFMQDDIMNLNLALRNGVKKSFYFIDEKSSPESAETSIYNLFISHVKAYNVEKNYQQKILNKRNIFASATDEF